MSVPVGRLGSLIDAVHEVVWRTGRRSGPKWRYGNVIGIDRPRLRDLDPAAARSRYGDRGRVVVALAVVVQDQVVVHVVFVLAAGDATAHFAGAGRGAAADRAASLAGFLARATRTVLSAAGIDSR
ncbi:hypothetical protein [Nocardia sp. NPDC046763]|uniref:hypothetical protein n=1 Tax=Nocardia sp. NPDC046763 TaxID=3155256 RepID=UPI0033F06503